MTTTNDPAASPPAAAGMPPATPPAAAGPAVVRADVAATLGLGADGGPRRGRRRAMLLGASALVVAAVLAGLWLARRGGPPVRYTTEAVVRGPLSVRVSATGNLQPTIQVDVGSELSGTVDTVLVNDNDRVRLGQPLARLDTSKLQDAVAHSAAALQAAQATLLAAQAGAREARATLARLEDAWTRSGGKVPSRADLDNAQAAADKGDADVAGARAAVAQAEAALRSDRTNLDKAVIRSPIDGVVLLRKVEPGQTVAASLQAPVLFTLAQSLTQMELQVEVDEADVGQVRAGQPASFGVDAYPDRTWPARIERVRYGSDTTNGVVTYQAVLAVGNDDLSLRPGMTATAYITTLQRDDALLVPNAALRYVPPSAGAAASGAGASSGSTVASLFVPRPPIHRAAKSVKVVSRGGRQTVWKLVDGQPVAVPIEAGATDGRQTEVLRGDLKPGDALVVDSNSGSP